MTRRDWFQFLLLLNFPSRRPSSEGDLSTFSLDPAAFFDSAERPTEVEIPLDWLVHVGGPFRDAFEKRIFDAVSHANNLSFSLRMKPDPVLTFEIEALMTSLVAPALAGRIDKSFTLSLVCRNADRRSWKSEVSFFSDLPWVSENDPEMAEAWIRSLGILFSEPGPSSVTLERFVREMRAAGVDSHEPPWIFWSRLPGWLKYKKEIQTEFSTQDRLEIDKINSRLAFLRCVLSPQDEKIEAQSLAVGEVMLNPTFETMEELATTGEELMALNRDGNFVRRRSVSAVEALIVDHVRDSFRVSNEELIKTVSAESAIEIEFVRRAVQRLIEQGYLLSADRSS